MNDNILKMADNYSMEEKNKFKEIVSQITFNKPTILLGKPIPLKETLVGIIELNPKNIILFLPVAVSHHDYYHYVYRGALIEYENPIIIVQNKEFLETVLKDTEDCQFVRCIKQLDVIASKEETEEEKIKRLEEEEKIQAELSLEILTKDEANDLFFKQNIDIRD